MKQGLLEKYRLMVLVSVLIGVAGGFLVGCGGPNGVSIGVFGGSRGTGMGIGVGFPIGSPYPDQGHVQMQESVASFKVGEVVGENDLYYRRFLGLTERNGFVVQDFYKSDGGVFEESVRGQGLGIEHSFSDKKLTNAYVLLWAEDVQGVMFAHDVCAAGALSQEVSEWLRARRIEGEFVIWFASGQKALSANFKNGQLDGQWAQWYEQGGKQVLGRYEQGEQVGIWSFSREDGVLTLEHDYGAFEQRPSIKP